MRNRRVQSYMFQRRLARLGCQAKCVNPKNALCSRSARKRRWPRLGHINHLFRAHLRGEVRSVHGVAIRRFTPEYQSVAN
jgi:hypothetical protein